MIHFKYGGSSAARTLACPSWHDLAKDIPRGQESSYATEGTRLHNIMELVLQGDYDDKDFIDEELPQDALNAWDNLCRKYGIVDYITEATFKLNDDIGGTADVFAWSENRVILVDWKFGQGVKVEVEGNAQGLFYAMCAEFEKPEIFKGKDLTLSIVQPMPSRGEDTLSTWDVPADVFELFKQTYMKAIQSSGTRAGSHCQFCPASPTCPVKTGEAQKALLMDTDQLSTLAASLDMVADLKTWIHEVESYAHNQLEEGAAIDGWKLVPKRATRKWSDADSVIALLKKKRSITNAMFMEPAKLMSPAKILKNVDNDLVSDYITSSSSGTTLAPESDKREGVLSSKALKSALDRL